MKMSTKRKKGVLLAILWTLLLGEAGAVARAQIIIGQEVKFDFTKPASIKSRVDYSDHDKLALSEKGLGWDANENQLVPDAWFQTTEPIAMGFAWTPTAAVTIHAHLDVDFAYIGVYSLGALYARYSPDAEHWSSWQAVMGASRPDKARLTHDYEGQIIIPNRVRQPYYALLAAYYKSDPEMSGDEEAAVRWIVKNDPHYFEKAQPFAGYMQLLFETPLLGGQHIKSLNALLIWTLPGLHVASKRERNPDPKKPSPPWQFRAKPQHAGE